MASRYETSLTSSSVTNNQIRPTKVALLQGSKALNSTKDGTHEALLRRFRSIGVQVFSVSEMTQAGINDMISSSKYDVIALVGEAEEFDLIRRNNSLLPKLRKSSTNRGGSTEDYNESIILAFAPSNYFRHAKSYLRIADAIILCDAPENDWAFSVSNVIYHFFECLVLPSMLNIDIADVKRIARGIGLALNLSDDSRKRIISRLPKSCLVARSALLHFSCNPDVRLSEVYSISKAIALKKGITNIVETQINTHLDARKLIRKVNVKMGIRMKTEMNRRDSSISSADRDPLFSNEVQCQEDKRISLTAIFFGL